MVTHSIGMRFRVWTREWATLGIEEGQVVTVKVLHMPEQRLMVANVVPLPRSGNS